MKEWKIKQTDNLKLPNLPQYPALILKLLALRGFTDEEKIRDFLDPDYNKLHDPFLFADMQKAVSRIRQAVAAAELITIYADYDADAITAASVVYLALQKLGAKIDYYIPDRFTEGYGVNLEAVKKISEAGAKLIITVDCGTNSIEEAELCQTLGIDLIITDHHEVTGPPAGGLPQAFALINPKNPKDGYPFPYLTGVGVAYKLVQALDMKGWEKWLLDLVAIGTVADCQSLSGENRILVSFGLKVLKKSRWPGVAALIKAVGVDLRSLDTYTLGFLLAPRINAAGRLTHASAAFKLLTANDPHEAVTLAKELNELNIRRQMLTDQVLSEARAQVELAVEKKVFVLHSEDWPKGIVGLVAGKLAEEFSRPVLVMEKGEIFATGSARSVADFDLVAALNFAKNYLQKFGGHTQAAGFTLVVEHIEAFHQKLLEYAESINFMIVPPSLELDAVLQPSDISWENYELLQQFAPFGIGNRKPRFAGFGLKVLDLRTVGNASKHLKSCLAFGEHTLDAIAFNQGFIANTLKIGDTVDAAFELNANEWNGNKSLQLKILDIKA